MLPPPRYVPWQEIALIALAVVPLLVAWRKKKLADGTVFWLLSFSPMVACLVFYSFVLRARVSLGHWPRPYVPDPSDLGFGLHQVAAVLSFPLAMASAASFVVLVLARLKVYWRSSRHRLGVLSFALTFGLWLYVALQDPGDFLKWLMD
jgi:hypothetical protein